TINGVAVVIFVMRGVVVWPQTMLMVVGAIIGGYGGAYFARKIDQRWVRGFVIVVGVSMTIYFFLRY
ncbi:MAG TPA: TSUP family transporter, partial [Ktedonobacteraceae bacterium]|nr:TSUP family transporter [Ktedonobacteraceae bacterium]